MKPISRSRFAQLLPLILGFSLNACAAKVYLLDRQTVLEEEAAGEWPELESRIQKQAKVIGATPFPSTQESGSKKRRTSILNGEATTELHSTQKTPAQKTTAQQ